MPGVKVYLKWFNYIDPQYTSKGESDLFRIMGIMGFRFTHPKFEELLIVPQKDYKFVVEKYSNISNKYTGHLKELTEKIKDLDNQHEVMKKESEIQKKDLEIQALRKDSEIRLMKKEKEIERMKSILEKKTY